MFFHMTFLWGGFKIVSVMKTLKTKVVNSLVMIIAVLMLVIFAFTYYLQLRVAENTADDNAAQVFHQIDQILESNTQDLAETQADYNESLLNKTESAAYMLENHPDIVSTGDYVELNKFAEMLEVDEIHLFDKEGIITLSTQPKYVGLSMESGDQIRFFKAMLDDTSLQLVQDIQPNTADGNMVQYAAVWSENKEFIVQIGVYPATVLKAREKNELPYIFSLLKSYADVNLLAIDKDTNEILGCTNDAWTGKTTAEIGLVNDPHQDRFFCDIEGVRSYVVLEDNHGVGIGYIIPTDVMYKNINGVSVYFTLSLLLITLLAAGTVSYFIQKYVIDEIELVNKDLRIITEGNLDVKVNAAGSVEFKELSDHIDKMVQSLLESQRQIEKDRDMDLLTGLYNRRGLDNELSKLKEEELGHCALLMVDADCLKTINDIQGHESGDLYLCHIAYTLQEAGTKHSICSRQGGDEFVIFIYGYDSEEELDQDLAAFTCLQDGRTVDLLGDNKTELRFSLGYAKAYNHIDYDAMMKAADRAMYENKRDRKSCPIKPKNK